MRSARVLLASVSIACAALASGCAAGPDGAGEDEDDLSAAQAYSGRSAPAPRCAETDRGLFFHGMSGFGRQIGGEGLCTPAIVNDGPNDFWSDVAFASAPSARVVGGYSAGRIPMLRRLAANRGDATTAVLLDGSWADGPRFGGKTGPDLVRAWLEADTSRRFVLVYLPSSAGWREYVALARGSVGDRVTACAMTHGSHGELSRIVGPELFLDPEAWLRDRCPTGRGS
jgi:hypothetical protein